MNFVEIRRGEAPLIISMPHTGTAIPAEIAARLASPWLGTRDADWWVHRLYDFALAMGATMVRTKLSRTVIDANRDPSGVSLYPGQATTELCPATTFDGEPLYRAGLEPDEAEIAARRTAFFDPYHAALAAEVERLRARHGKIVLFEAHSIRSHIPRLFDGELPQFNIGTNNDATCAPALTKAVEEICAGSGYSHVVNGRFRGGWTTRHYGQPDRGIHAIQLELAIRGYMDEPETVTEENWPTPYNEARAHALCVVLKRILEAAMEFSGA